MMRSKLLIFAFALGFFATVPHIFSETQWLRIDSFTVNYGQTNEVAVGQTMRFDTNVTNVGPNTTDVNAGVSIYYTNGTLLYSLSNKTKTLNPTDNYNFYFTDTVSNWGTGYYNAVTYVMYEKNGTNETINNTIQIKVISVDIVSLGVEHVDAAPEEIATFIQTVNNTGNVTADVRANVWVRYDKDGNGEYDDCTECYRNWGPTSRTVQPNSLEGIDVTWNIPGSFASCDYTNSSRYSMLSQVNYGGVTKTANTTDFNLTYVEICKETTGGYAHSGISSWLDYALGDPIGAGIELKNFGSDNTTIHRAEAYIVDEYGTTWQQLYASDTGLSIDGLAYKDNNLPGHFTNCTEIQNSTIAHQGADKSNATPNPVQDFAFTGTVPTNLPTDRTYNIKVYVDYGLPRDIYGLSWDIIDTFTFYLQDMEITGISAQNEVTFNGLQNITVTVNNTGPNTIDDPSVSLDRPAQLTLKIYNTTGDVKANFSSQISNLAPGATRNMSFEWTVPSNLPLGTYYANATVDFGVTGSYNLSTTFEVVYLGLSNVTTVTTALFESSNISVIVSNDGPTNATLTSLTGTIEANESESLGSYSNNEVEANGNRTFEFYFYFNDSLGINNGTHPVKIERQFAGRSYYNNDTTITLLPAGIKSFSAPSQGNNETSFISTAVLKNIANSSVNVSLNLSSNLSGEINTTNITLGASSTTTLNYNITLNQTGVHNLTLTANYSGLPAPLTRSATTNISDQKADLTISQSDISFSPSSPTTGQTVTISANVTNTGTADASNFLVELKINDTSIQNNTVSVAAGSSNVTQFTWSAVLGTHNVTVIADTSNIIAGEVSETNNNATSSITVTAPVSPTTTTGTVVGRSLPPTEPSYLKQSVELTGSGIADLIYKSGDAKASTKYIVHPNYASLAGVFSSNREVVLSPEMSDLLFETYKDSKFGNIIRKEPSLLEAGVYEMAADYVLNSGGADTIVITRGDIAADSLAASTFTSLIDGKMLLVKPDGVPISTLQVLEKFRPTKIYIIGEEEAISPEVEVILNKYAFMVERIGGKDRYETSLKLAKEVQGMTDPTIAVVTDGKEPVLYAASLAVKLNSPLVYMDESSPEETEELLKDFKVKAKLY